MSVDLTANLEEAAALAEMRILVEHALLPPGADLPDPVPVGARPSVLPPPLVVPEPAGSADAASDAASVSSLSTLGTERSAASLLVRAPAVRHSATDEDLLRNLRARKGLSIPGAEKFLRVLHFREAFSVDRFLDQPCTDAALFRDYMPHSYHKHDREGRPLYIERTGAIDIRKVLSVLDPDDIIRRRIWHLEFLSRLCREATASTGRAISKGVVIMDLSHLSYSPGPVGMDVLKTALRISAAMYAERLHQVFIINAPFIFQGIWAVVSVWLDPVTKAKLRILGAGFQETLLEFIAPDCLPAEYGGTCTCGQSAELNIVGVAPAASVAAAAGAGAAAGSGAGVAGGAAGGAADGAAVAGGPVGSAPGACVVVASAAGKPAAAVPCVPLPSTLTADEMMVRAGYKFMDVVAGASGTLSFEVPASAAVAGAVLYWNWRSVDHDIVARVVFQPTPSPPGSAASLAPVELCAELRLQEHKGVYVLPASGTVAMHFSNAHSRFRAKVVQARVHVTADAHEIRMRAVLPHTNKHLFVGDDK